MKYNGRFIVTLTAALFLVTGSSQISLGIAYTRLLVPAQNLTPECPDGIEDIDQGPATGCGELGDAELNKAKNAQMGFGTVAERDDFPVC